MKVAVLFEESGVVRRAFRERGHDAWSVDLLPSRDDSPHHLETDVTDWFSLQGLASRWDLIIMHPPCTALSVSGNRHYGKSSSKYSERLKSIDQTWEWFNNAKAIADRVCMENPVGVLGGSPQYIQPHWFGEDASKKTGLWLHNLPGLVSTLHVAGKLINNRYVWGNQTPSGQNKLGPSADRARIRSTTYEGVAEAMVDQWGVFINCRSDIKCGIF